METNTLYWSVAFRPRTTQLMNTYRSQICTKTSRIAKMIVKLFLWLSSWIQKHFFLNRLLSHLLYMYFKFFFHITPRIPLDIHHLSIQLTPRLDTNQIFLILSFAQFKVQELSGRGRNGWNEVITGFSVLGKSYGFVVLTKSNGFNLDDATV